MYRRKNLRTSNLTKMIREENTVKKSVKLRYDPNLDKCDRFKNKFKLFITMGLGENLPMSTCHEAEDDDYLDDLLEIGRTKTQRVLEDGYLRFSNLEKNLLCY